MKDTRNQRRAVCPACFATQAIRGTRLVAHGYKRPQQWHQNVGTCSGAGAPHFGTPEGRDYTANLAQRLRDSATSFMQQADDVIAGTAQVLTTKRVARGVVMEVVKENPTELDRRDYAAALVRRALGCRASAVEFDKAVSEWVAAEPTDVTVEAKGAPLVHWHGGYWATRGGMKACAGSLMGSLKTSACTSDLENVTCEKCKNVAARLAAKKEGVK